MKLLHIIGTLDPKSGGPIEGVLRSSEILKERGYFRNIASLDSPNDAWVSSCPVPSFALGTLDAMARKKWRWIPWVRYGYTPRLVPWLKQHAREYDVIIVNGLWNYCALAARLVLPSAGVPYFVFTHGMLDPWFRRTYPLKAILKQIFWWLSEGPLLSKACGVLFTTDEERILARNAFWPYSVKEIVVGYGTADVAGNSDLQQREFRDRLPKLTTRPFILYLSRIHPKKGCDLLIEAFAKLARERGDIDLVIAGPDEAGWGVRLRKQAEAAGVAERIHWPGMLTGDAKWGAFRACEVFILPSHQENFGIVVAEAMACAKPVLITNKVNIWREVQDGGGGLVDNDDRSGIESLLIRFMSYSHEERRQMGAAARSIFLKHFLIDANVSKLLEVLNEHSR